MIDFNFFKQWLLSLLHPDIEWYDLHNALINNHILDECYHKCNFNKVKGDIFEYVTKYIFLNNGYNEVYLYDEIPNNLKEQLGLPNNDRGIDLIARKDKWIGIQCKWRSKFSKSIKYI